MLVRPEQLRVVAGSGSGPGSAGERRGSPPGWSRLDFHGHDAVVRVVAERRGGLPA